MKKTLNCNKNGTINLRNLKKNQKETYVELWEDFCSSSSWHKKYKYSHGCPIDNGVRLAIEDYIDEKEIIEA